MQNYVSSGGRLITIGDSVSRITSFLQHVFNLTWLDWGNCGESKLTDYATFSEPNFLPYAAYVHCITETKNDSLYEFMPGFTTVAQTSFGSGNISFLGYDYNQIYPELTWMYILQYTVTGMYLFHINFFFNQFCVVIGKNQIDINDNVRLVGNQDYDGFGRLEVNCMLYHFV